MKLETVGFICEIRWNWNFVKSLLQIIWSASRCGQYNTAETYRRIQDVGAGALFDTKMQAEGLQYILQADAGPAVSGMAV